MPVKFLRTPEENFENLPGWNYAPKYIEDLPGYENQCGVIFIEKWRLFFWRQAIAL